MKENKRVHERIETRKRVTLFSPDKEKITATIGNVSLSGLLLCSPSSPIEDGMLYKVVIHSAHNTPIYLFGKAVWVRDKEAGMKIISFHMDGKDLYQAFIYDITTTNEIINLLNDGWLDYLFEDKQGKQVQVKYK